MQAQEDLRREETAGRKLKRESSWEERRNWRLFVHYAVQGPTI
jgi:hypothetical protein